MDLKWTFEKPLMIFFNLKNEPSKNSQNLSFLWTQIVRYFWVWTLSWETLSSFSKQMVVLNVDRLAASSTVASFYSSPALLLSHPVLHITNRKLKLHHWSALLCSFGIEEWKCDIRSPTDLLYSHSSKMLLITFSLLLCIISTIQIWSYFQIHPSFCFSIDTLCDVQL